MIDTRSFIPSDHVLVLGGLLEPAWPTRISGRGHELPQAARRYTPLLQGRACYHLSEFIRCLVRAGPALVTVHGIRLWLGEPDGLCRKYTT